MVLPGGDSPSSTVVPTAEVENARVQITPSLGFKIVVVEADDVADTTGYHAHNGIGSIHPPFRWEDVDCGR